MEIIFKWIIAVILYLFSYLLVVDMVYKIIHIDLNGIPNIMTTELSNINLFEEDFQKYSLNKSNYYVMYGTPGKHRVRLKFTDDIFYSNLYIIKTRCNNNLTNIKLEDIINYNEIKSHNTCHYESDENSDIEYDMCTEPCF